MLLRVAGLYRMPASYWIIWAANRMEQSTLLLMLLPLAVAISRWRWLTQPLRVLTIGLVCMAALIALLTFRPLSEGDESLLWHCYTVVQTLFLGSVYYYIFLQRWQRLGVLFALAAFLVFALLDWFWLERNQPVHAYTHTLQSTLLLSFGVLYFYQLARHMPAIRLENDPFFLVTSGIVMYFSGTVLLYVFVLPLIAASDALGQHIVSLLVSAVAVLQYTLFALAFYRASRPSSLLLLHE